MDECLDQPQVVRMTRKQSLHGCFIRLEPEWPERPAAEVDDIYIIAKDVTHSRLLSPHGKVILLAITDAKRLLVE